jgi:hypothetical protein
MKAISKQAEAVFRAAIARTEERRAASIDEYWKIGKSGGAIMPLCVEHIGTVRFQRSENDLPLWSFAHYYEQNGDQMRDPDIVMIDAPGGLYPISYRQDGLGMNREYVVYNDAGEIRGFMKVPQADLAAFCNGWAKNLKEQQGL